MLYQFHLNLNKLLSCKQSLYLFQKQTFATMAKRALVLLAPGAEEMECIIAVDVLRRGGVEVTLGGVLGPSPVQCSRGVIVTPDATLEDAVSKGPYDMIVLPGGLGGAKVLSESKEVGTLLKEQESAGRLIAAICAAPTALSAHGIAQGKSLTSYPTVESQLKSYVYKIDKVVVDGNLTTSRGPGTAFDFAVQLVEQLMGKEKAAEVAKGMLLEP